jgi:hypothetical protein
MAIELKYPNSPIDGYIKLENIILPAETYAALRDLAISQCQSPDGMARLLIENAVALAGNKPRRRGIELLDGLPRRRAVVEDDDEAPAPRRRQIATNDEDEAPAPRRTRRAVIEDEDEAPAPRRARR